MKAVITHLDSEPARSSPPPMLIGQQLIQAGKLSEQDMLKIVAVQRLTKSRFGEIAVEMGLVTHADVQEMLSKQYQYPSSLAGRFDANLIAATDPHSAGSEAYRTLRSELTLRWVSDQNKFLAITSARTGQGASVLAANLALVFAQQGARILLIDGNLRKPRQQELFRLDRGAGLSGLLTGRCDIYDAIGHVPHFENLYVITAGATPPNPQELIGRPAFTQVIQQVRNEFDFIILDTPPVLEFADARIIARHAGACVLSVKRDVTRVADVNKVKTALSPTGAMLIGAVVFSA